MSLNTLRTVFLQWHGVPHCWKHSNLSFPNSESPQEESMMCKICNFCGKVIRSSPSTELDMTKKIYIPTVRSRASCGSFSKRENLFITAPIIVTFRKIFTGFPGYWTAKCRCYNLTSNRISFSYVPLKTILRTLSMPFSSTQKRAWMPSTFLAGLVTLRSVLKSVPSIRLRLCNQTSTLNNFTVAERIGSFRWLLSKRCNFLLKSDKNNAHCTEKSRFFPACEIFIGEKSVSNRVCRERGE